MKQNYLHHNYNITQLTLMLVILPNKIFAKLQCIYISKQKEEINENDFTTNPGYSPSLIFQKCLTTKEKRCMLIHYPPFKGGTHIAK